MLIEQQLPRDNRQAGRRDEAALREAATSR
jgi:hypothetical protein